MFLMFVSKIISGFLDSFKSKLEEPLISFTECITALQLLNKYYDALAILITEIDHNDGVAVAIATAKQSHLFGKGFLRPWSMVISDSLSHELLCIVDSIDRGRLSTAIVTEKNCTCRISDISSFIYKF